MSNYDDYITGTDKPFAENINDALLLSNVFDLTVPIQAPTMFRDSSWIDTTSRRKCGVAILTLKEALPSGVSVSTVDGQSVLTGTGTVKLGFYPNFNSFGRFKSISWEDIGTVQVNLKTVNNTTILSNISKGIIENPSVELRKLQEIVIEIVLNNSTLKTLDVVMENKQQERYGATVGISDVTGLEDTITEIRGKDTEQDGRLDDLEDADEKVIKCENIIVSNYNPSFNNSIYIGCKVTDSKGVPIENITLTLFKNSHFVGSGITDELGSAYWTNILCNSVGLQHFTIKTTNMLIAGVDVNVQGWEQVATTTVSGVTYTCSHNGEGLARVRATATDVTFAVGSTHEATNWIPTDFKPSTDKIVFLNRYIQGNLGLYLFSNGAVGVYNGYSSSRTTSIGAEIIYSI